MTTLTAADGPPALVTKDTGASAILLLSDHAGRVIPQELGDLGLAPPDLDRHIAWDIGVAGLGKALAEWLDAVFIHQRYSRLVIDCNRALETDGLIVEVSDQTFVPGNADLTGPGRQARIDEIYLPYHERISAELRKRRDHGQSTLLVSLHSFTPVFGGFIRPWKFGVLHRNDSGLARSVLEKLRAVHGKAVGDNEPYAMDGIDFTIPFHADAFGLPYVEIEVRQDLIGTEAEQIAMAHFLAPLLLDAARDYADAEPPIAAFP